MVRRLLKVVMQLSLLLCVVVWLLSYALAVEWTFRPAHGRWCQTGVNYGTTFFATGTDAWPGEGSRLLVYDARDRGVSLKGFGFYFSRTGRTPGGTGSVPAASVPLWLPVVVILAGAGVRRARARRRAARIAEGLCSSCAYDLTGNVSGVCPECGSPSAGMP